MLSSAQRLVYRSNAVVSLGRNEAGYLWRWVSAATHPWCILRVQVASCMMPPLTQELTGTKMLWLVHEDSLLSFLLEQFPLYDFSGEA